MTSPYKYIDFHTHRWHQNMDVVEILSLHGAQSRDKQGFTIGFHPWWTNSLLSDDQLMLLKTFYEQESSCLALGECGLDKLKGSNLTLQEAIFIQQLELANQLHAPVVIHCVRAFDRILRLRKTYGLTPWVVHGFVRNKVLAKQVLDAGMFVSVAPHENMSMPFRETLEYLPMDRFFIETDSDTSSSIQERYVLMATLKRINVETLKLQMIENTATFCGRKWAFLKPMF